MKFLLKNKYWNLNEDYNKEKMLYLLIDRPDYIDYLNNFIWINNKGQFHRNYDLPAYVGVITNTVSWYKNRKKHRKNNKPAIIFSWNEKEYWINNNFIRLEE